MTLHRRNSGVYETSTDPSQFSFTLAEDASYVAANFALREDAFTLEVKDQVGWINHVDNESGFLAYSERTSYEEMANSLNIPAQ